MAAGVLNMTFSGGIELVEAALVAAREAGYDSEPIKSMYSTPEEQALGWIELTDVLTEFNVDSSEWASLTLARAQALMEQFGFRHRATGTPAGAAHRIPQSATLRDAATHAALRPASFDEWMNARQAPAPGLIEVDGRRCIVTDDDES